MANKYTPNTDILEELDQLLDTINVLRHDLENMHTPHENEKKPSTSTEFNISPNPFPSDRFQTYKKLPGTEDLGRKFEQVTCAYYALHLSSIDFVEDFEMSSNNSAYGKFDDICLRITFGNGISQRFLLQLKHKESKSINLSDLRSESKSNGFGVKKYVESMLKMDLEQETVCILFTNCSMKIEGTISLTDGVTVERHNQPDLEYFLINTEERLEDAIFEIKSKSLKQKFYFFTSQMSVRKTEEKVNAILRSLFRCEIFGAFMSFMRNWWSGRFMLTKHDVIAKISELALSPYLKVPTDERSNEKSESLKRAILSFSLTLVKEADEDIVEYIWKSENTWTDEDLSKAKEKYGLKESQVWASLWYLGNIPLIVKVDDWNKTVIMSVMNILLKKIENKKIVLIGKVKRDDFNQCDIFETLSDFVRKCGDCEHCFHMMQKFKVSLQGRGSIALEKLLSIDEELATLIGTRELLQMSQQDYLLIGNKKEEPTDVHIPRTVSPIFVKTEDILNSNGSLRDSLTIINCDEKYASKFQQKRDTYTIELSLHMGRNSSEEPENAIVLSKGSNCTSFQFRRICKRSKNSNVYLLQQFDDTSCILMFRKGEKFICEYIDSNKTIKQDEILECFNNSLHVFCAPPGMGKTTLMRVLYNNCPPDCLAVYVNLVSCNSFLAKQSDNEEMFVHFVYTDENNLSPQLIDIFRKTHKLYMFLDGLDEVNSQHVGRILRFVKHASSNGVNIWISARENLRERMCLTLHVVPIEIKELGEDEQKIYISRRLEPTYTREEIERITRVVFNSSDLINSQNLLGIPLQLHIITETFLHDRQVYENLNRKDLFVLTHMYKIFFEGKIKFAWKKFVDGDNDQLFRYLTYLCHIYEVLALEACLSKDDYKKLHLTLGTDREKFLHQLRTEGDRIGIITAASDGVLFVHQTYAEYFAALWFKENPSKVVLLRSEILSNKYENLRIIFDVMLAESNPLHLAIIYKDIEQFERYIGDIHSRDDGGRTVFHLAFSYGQKYDSKTNNAYESMEKLKRQGRETPFYMKIIDRLLQGGRIPQARDDLFHYDCVSYALQAGCLYPIEQLLINKLTTFERLQLTLFEHYEKQLLAACCAQFGYSNLLKRTMHTFDSKYILLELAVIGCANDVCAPPRQGNIEVVKSLVESGLPLDTPDSDILKLACSRKRFDMLEILIENKAKCAGGDTILHILVQNCPKMYYEEVVGVINKFNINVNATNDEGATALHLACGSADLKIVVALLDNGADLSILDHKGRGALHYASSFHRQEVIKLLLNRCQSVNAQDDDGTTPLQLAAERGHSDVVKTLLEHGADPKLADNRKNSVVHYASKSWKDNPDTTRLLISGGLDANVKNTDGFSPLHLAYTTGNLQIAELLTKNAPKAAHSDTFNNGQTLLHLACKSNKNRVVIKLLQEGADPNILDHDNRNALHYYLAQLYPREDVVSAMLNHGLDLRARYSYGHSLLHIACQHSDILIVKELVENGADVNALDENGRNPLHLVLRLLQHIEKSLRDSIKNHYNRKNIQHTHDSNALMIECKKCHIELARELKRPNSVDRLSQTFRMLVGNSEKLDKFLENSLSANSRNYGVPTHIVTRFIIFEMVSYLVEKASDVNTADVHGKTPCDRIRQKQNIYPEIMALFMEPQLSENFTEAGYMSDEASDFTDSSGDSDAEYIDLTDDTEGDY